MKSKFHVFLSSVVSLLLIFSFVSDLAGSQTKNQKQPNIIFILADDLGAGDLQCTGHPYAKTPNLDKLAKQGVRFDRAYMAGSWCAPSRYGLMSGQYPAREFDRTRQLRADEPCVTSVLKNAGYKTAHIGKWHLTDKKNKTVMPIDFGIEEHFISNCPDTWNTWTKEERNKEYWRAETTDAYVDRTIDFITETNSDNSSKPFFVNLWIYPTHSYIHPTPEQLAVYNGLKVDYKDFSPHQQEFLKFVAKHGDINKAMQAYCADITAMDKALGRLFKFLKKEGLDKNTLIVFTSDNGPGPLATQINNQSVVERYKERPDLLNNVGSSRIYKERKISLYDGGIRVPYIVRWPGEIPKDKVDSESVLHGVDWLPTLASICNIDLPKGQYDGIDIKSAFKGKGVKRQAPIYWTHNKSVASLDDNWKCMLNDKGEFELYDIVNDPSELKNIKVDFPEVAEEMEENLRDWHKNIKK